MSVREQIADLASRLCGTSWWDKAPSEWTRDDDDDHKRASDEEKQAYFEDLLRRPVDVSGLIDEPPDVSEFEG